MPTKVIAGNTIVLTWTAKELTDPFASPPTYDAYDPATPTLILEDQDGQETPYTYPASSVIKRPTTRGGQVFDPTGSGQYYAVVKTTTAMIGSWKYQWRDPDADTPGLIEGAFTVTAPKIL